MDMEVTDLPQPLSPTMASVSPSSTWKDTPLTARLTPPACGMDLEVLDFEQGHGHTPFA